MILHLSDLLPPNDIAYFIDRAGFKGRDQAHDHNDEETDQEGWAVQLERNVQGREPDGELEESCFCVDPNEAPAPHSALHLQPFSGKAPDLDI